MVETPAIDVSSVTRSFADLVAVDDLSFQVGKGEIFGLLGPNGAGKTTMINLILGLLAPDSGSIRVLNYDLVHQAREVHRRVGYVPQETNVYLDLSAEDNLWHHAALFCPDLGGVKEHMADLLRFTNLWERRKDPVRTYSGGMQRRLALARALLHDPEIIFFDEPTLGVDVQGRFALWEHIQEQRKAGKTFVISTNNMLEADTLCDRLLIIDHGRAITLDTPENLKAAMGHEVVTLRTTPVIENPEEILAPFAIRNLSRPLLHEIRFEMKNAGSEADTLIQQLTKTNQLESIQISRPSLDDVFLHHTGRALRD